MFGRCYGKLHYDRRSALHQRMGHDFCPDYLELAAERASHQEAFIRDRVLIMVATVAYSMNVENVP
ncbi:hypothetical protein [Treponema sp. Marseille-Q4130]|uniref:hypothetical protein n=1 Tax=Treponema sp. Marseille-Q4130 TaxID=2766702 RepID=UPI001651BBCC|nr:hypothetical protein [Treponema sp. Marseille-Q4130]MBC6719897.1 hypothetical protein [Treponema sp. Marseille-Q4130]